MPLHQGEKIIQPKGDCTLQHLPITDKQSSTAHRNGKPLVWIDRQGVGGSQVAIQWAHRWIKDAKQAVCPIDVQPDVPFVAELRDLRLTVYHIFLGHQYRA